MNTYRPSQFDTALEIDDRAGIFRVRRSSYVDPGVLAVEMEAIFSKCWLYVGHDSELGRPNDFLTRRIAGRPVIFLRDHEGAVRCFLNVCPHRGAQLCRLREGRARSFGCIYHGWTFENTGRVLSVTGSESYGPGFAAPHRNDLVPVPKLEQYRGFWFLNFDAAATGLADYLGEARDYIDLVVDQAEERMQITGGVQEYSIRANWKLLAENSTDILHIFTLHPTYLDLVATNSAGTLPRGKTPGYSRSLGNGHAVVEREALHGRPIARWIPLWGDAAKVEIDQIYARLVARHGAERARRMATCSRNLLIFPNLVINDIMSITVRCFQPVSVDFMEVNVWSLSPAEEAGTPAMARRLTNFLEFLGPGGFATPDDIEALESCQRAFGAWREAPWNDLSKGFGSTESDIMDELPQRAFWLAWRDRLLTDRS
jgi:p-cumate 2,3-dioxygenase alpha subunit